MKNDLRFALLGSLVTIALGVTAYVFVEPEPDIVYVTIDTCDPGSMEQFHQVPEHGELGL